jgi:hypothetical protein
MWKIILNRSIEHRFPIIIGLLLILFNFFPLLMGQSMLFGDNYSLMVPGKLFSAQWLAKGVIPFWNPTQFAGISLIGDINQSLFYPSTLLFMIFPANIALSFTLLSHLLFSFLGAYFLAREISPKLSKYSWLLAAVFWSFSPHLMGALNNLATFQSISYVPWVVLGCLHFGRRRLGSLWYLPILITLQLLGGYPQHVLFSVLFGVTLSWLLQDKISIKKITNQMHYFGRWAAVGVITLLLSAWIWLPFLQNLNQSTRSLQTTEQAQTGSLRLDDLIKIVTPTFFDNPSVGYKWGPGWNRPTNLVVYFSWIGLIALIWLLLQAKNQKLDLILFGSILVCLLFSFSESLPLFSLMQGIPIIGSSRGVTPILSIATLAGSLLIGRAVVLMKLSAISQRKYFTVVLLMTLLFGLLFIFLKFNFSQIWTFANSVLGGALQNSVFHTIEKDRVLSNSILFSISIQSVLLFLTSWFLLHKRKMYIVILIICFDLVFFTKQYYFFGPSVAYDPPRNETVINQVENSLGSNYRLLTRNYNAPYADFGAYAEALIVRQPFSDSFVDAQELSNFSVALKMKELLTPGWNTPVNIPTINGYTTLLPVSISKDFGNTSSEHGINRLPEILTTHNQLKKWSVGYYLVDTWYPNYGEQFPDTVVASGEGWKLYQLPNALSRIRYGSGESAEISAFDENPNELVMTIESDREQDLVVADRYDQDWKAIVNGKSVKVSDVDGMRSIPLEWGTNQIRMWYSPTLFYVGLFVSGLTGITLLMWIAVRNSLWQTK